MGERSSPRGGVPGMSSPEETPKRLQDPQLYLLWCGSPKQSPQRLFKALILDALQREADRSDASSQNSSCTTLSEERSGFIHQSHIANMEICNHANGNEIPLAAGRLEFKLEYKHVYLTVVLPGWALPFFPLGLLFILLLIHQEEAGEKQTSNWEQETGHSTWLLPNMLTHTFFSLCGNQHKTASRCHVCLYK